MTDYTCEGCGKPYPNDRLWLVKTLAQTHSSPAEWSVLCRSCIGDAGQEPDHAQTVHSDDEWRAWR